MSRPTILNSDQVIKTLTSAGIPAYVDTISSSPSEREPDKLNVWRHTTNNGFGKWITVDCTFEALLSVGIIKIDNERYVSYGE